VNGTISTIELPEAEVKRWWARDEWRGFVQDFQERHPTAKTMEKNQPKKDTAQGGSTGVLVPPRKRQALVDISKHLVDEGCAPGSTKLCTVQVINGRFGADVKSAEYPTLVVSDGGPYVHNSTGHEAFWMIIDHCFF
jgi:hypothetical protein